MIQVIDLSYHDNKRTKAGHIGTRRPVAVLNTGLNVHANSAYVLKEHIEVSDIKAFYDYLVEMYNDDLDSILYKLEDSNYMNFFTDDIDIIVGEDVLVYDPIYGSSSENNSYVYINGQWENGEFDWDNEEIISSGTKNTDKKFIPIEANNYFEEEEKEIYNNIIKKLKPFIQEEVRITRPVIKQATLKQDYNDYLPRESFTIADFIVARNDRKRSSISAPPNLDYNEVFVNGEIIYRWNEIINGAYHELTDMSKLTIQFDEGMMKQLELLSDENYEDFLNIFETIEYK